MKLIGPELYLSDMDGQVTSTGTKYKFLKISKFVQISEQSPSHHFRNSFKVHLLNLMIVKGLWHLCHAPDFQSKLWHLGIELPLGLYDKKLWKNSFRTG